MRLVERLRNTVGFPRARATVPTRADRQCVQRIIATSDSLADISDEELRTRFAALSGRPDSAHLDSAVVEAAFALIREASRRAIGMAHYDVQLLAGLALVRGDMAEMATGEGKTLVATLPACAWTVTGKPVHVMTVNAYLARRDHDLMQPVFSQLGLTSDVTETGATPQEKRRAYSADITYGTGPEFGFDYLKDQLGQLQQPRRALGQSFSERLRGRDSTFSSVQTGFGFALVDEADSVLVDEANSALILSGSSGNPSPWPHVYLRAHETARSLREDEHFSVDRNKGVVTLVEKGIHTVFSSPEELRQIHLVRPWANYVEQALRAIHVIERDVEYVVMDDAIQIVDEFTGRRFEDRSWSDGLHQAVEAAEGVTITEESNAMLRISRQRYLSFYDQIAGMTGTARGCEGELRKIYDLGICQIPRRKPEQRIDEAMRLYTTSEQRDEALITDVVATSATGQPVLIGTRTVKDSERIARRLAHHGVKVRVLNARQDEDEAGIIAMGGQRGAVTIATNMAGRGSDIPLGAGVEELGGLAVIARELNESPRIDRQLAGRAGRQGDPGVSRQYAAADDDLFVRYEPDLAKQMRHSSVDQSGRVLKDWADAIERLRTDLERHRFESRQSLVRRDEWLHDLLEKAV